MQKLAGYLQEHKLTLRAFARENEMSASFLSELLAEDESRRKEPSLQMALKIQNATGGAVTVGDWPKFAAIGVALDREGPSNRRAS